MAKILLVRQSFANRLKDVLLERGVQKEEHQQYLAERMEVGAHVTRNWLKAEYLPSSHLSPRLASRLGVTVEWLLSGHGEKYGEEKGRRHFSDKSKRSINPTFKVTT